MLRVERYGRTRFWALYDGDTLVVVTVYKTNPATTFFPPVRHYDDWILSRKTSAFDGLSIAPHATMYYIL